MTIRLVLPVPPSANVMYRNWRGSMVLSADGRNYKTIVLACARQQGVKADHVLTGDVAVTFRWFRAQKSGDVDNRTKPLLDALQEVAFANDKQVVELHAYRDDTDCKNARVEVTVEQR